MKRDIVARCCLVSGRVQGVHFRASTRSEALVLGVAGHARNLPDGRVEILAVGSEAAVAQLIRWLGKGPPTARVDLVEVNEVPAEPTPLEFVVR